ncbi:MAG: tRNA1(Val) (adenine(37)-N6)-methyltransferase [Acidobacteriota bacterium]
MIQAEETLDSFYHGKILVIQKKKGYRFAVDSPLLASFIQTREEDICCEMGTGNGIVSLLLSLKPFRYLVTLEIQESLARLARRNICLNHLEKRIAVLQIDFLWFSPKKKFDVVFSNPPYIQKDKGHRSPSEEKSIAKHEIKSDIFAIMRKTAELLKKEGRSYFIFPAGRKNDFFKAVEESGLKVGTIRYVYPAPAKPAGHFLTECRFQPGRSTALPSLYLRDEKGRATPEAEAVYSGMMDTFHA